LPGGGREDLTSVTVVDPGTRRVRVVLLSIEGTILFDGVSAEGEHRILRSVKRLSDPRFVAGLFRDVEFLNLAPKGTLDVQRGNTNHCTWHDTGGWITEVTDLPGGGRVMRRFNPKREETMQARLSMDSGREAASTHLRVQERRPYTLDLNLVSFEFVDSTQGLFDY